MSDPDGRRTVLDLDRGTPWERVYTAAPLVVIGTREEERYDLAPKHQATPIGWSGLFGFVCTPEHATHRNAIRDGAFTVTFPRADGVVLASLAASPRHGGARGEKPVVDALPTFPARTIDGVFLEDGVLFLECALARVVDGLDGASLVIGRIVHAMADREAVRASEVDDRETLRRAPPLVYLVPDRYATATESAAFPFPEGFRR